MTPRLLDTTLVACRSLYNLFIRPDRKVCLESRYVQLINCHLPVTFLQLAKLAGNNVVATCGGQEKAQLLRSLGVDRVIDYRKEDIASVNGLSRKAKKICYYVLKQDR